VVHFRHVRNKLNNTARVAPLIVVPRDELDKVGVEGDASSGVEDGRMRVTDKVARDDRVFRVAEDALCNSYALAHVQLRMRRMTDLQAWLLRRLLDRLLNLVVGRTLLETDDEIDDRHVASRYTERHSGKLAVQARDDLADSLGRTRGRRNNVRSRTTSTTPVL